MKRELWYLIQNYLTLDKICEVLSFIGLIYFVVKKFILRKAPVPSSALGHVPKELLDECIALLKKQEKEDYGVYHVPEGLMDDLKADMSDEETLKELLCDICAHMGINGDFIRLELWNTPVPDRAGQIATDLAFTTISLEMQPYYTLDSVIAVLAHEATHLHLYYKGIKMKDTWENEVLTDTAAVFCGFGEYIYRGYAVFQGEMALSYRKVGYIKQKDVKYIMDVLTEGEAKQYEDWNGI